GMTLKLGLQPSFGRTGAAGVPRVCPTPIRSLSKSSQRHPTDRVGMLSKTRGFARKIEPHGGLKILWGLPPVWVRFPPPALIHGIDLRRGLTPRLTWPSAVLQACGVPLPTFLLRRNVLRRAGPDLPEVQVEPGCSLVHVFLGL